MFESIFFDFRPLKKMVVYNLFRKILDPHGSFLFNFLCKGLQSSLHRVIVYFPIMVIKCYVSTINASLGILLAIVDRGIARGQPPPNYEKVGVREMLQICNEIDTLEGSIEIASGTALFYLEKDVSLYTKGAFH